jgi:hypothetical protein
MATLLSRKMAITETPVDDRPLTAAELAVLAPDAAADYQRIATENDDLLGEHPASDDVQGKPGHALVAFSRAGGRVMLGADAVGLPQLPGFANLKALNLTLQHLRFHATRGHHDRNAQRRHVPRH